MKVSFERLETFKIVEGDFLILDKADWKLEKSLDVFGIKEPLWVWKESKDFVLVDGYKRFRWAKKKAIETLPVLIFPKDTSKKDLFVARVLKFLGRELNLLEKAIIIDKLSNFFSPQEIKRDFFPLFEIVPKPGTYRRLLVISRGSEGFKMAILNEIISEKTAYALAGMEEEDRTLLVMLFYKLRCSASLQKEILESIEDIARIQDCRPGDVVRDSIIQGVMADDRLTPYEKTERLRAILREKLFPRLVKRENFFKEVLKKLPPSVNLMPPKNFEGEEWRLTISFSGRSDLAGKLKSVEDKVFSILENFFKSYVS